MSHVVNETWDYRVQLHGLMKDLNSKEIQKQGLKAKVLYGKLPQHFIDRLFERVPRTEINPVVTEMLHFIHDNKGVIKSQVKSTVTNYEITIKEYTVYIELNLGGPTGENVIIIPKTIIKTT